MDVPEYGAFQCGSTPVYFNQITDGLSNTIMAGEKHVPLDGWGFGPLDSSTYNADNLASCTRAAAPGVGLSQSLKEPNWKFGSYHTAVCQFAFCDGSVQGLPHGISPNILMLLVNRSDGQVIPPY
jgi:prepilin-type processing-associated H-X9-DG protein